MEETYMSRMFLFRHKIAEELSFLQNTPSLSVSLQYKCLLCERQMPLKGDGVANLQRCRFRFTAVIYSCSCQLQIINQ